MSETAKSDLTIGKHGDKGRYVTTEDGSQFFLTKSGEIGRTGKSIGGTARGGNSGGRGEVKPGSDRASGPASQPATGPATDPPAESSAESKQSHPLSDLPEMLRKELIAWNTRAWEATRPLGWAKLGAERAHEFRKSEAELRAKKEGREFDPASVDNLGDAVRSAMSQAWGEIAGPGGENIQKMLGSLKEITKRARAEGVDIAPFIRQNQIIPRSVAAKLKPNPKLFDPPTDDERFSVSSQPRDVTPLAAAIVDRFAARAAGLTVEEYAARKLRNSPGQLGLWDDTARGDNLLRSPARQQSFDWDESRVARKPSGGTDGGQFAPKSGGGGGGTDRGEGSDAKRKGKAESAKNEHGVRVITTDDIGDGKGGTFDRLHSGLAGEVVQSKIAIGMKGIEGREYAIMQHPGGKWQLASRPGSKGEPGKEKPKDSPVPKTKAEAVGISDAMLGGGKQYVPMTDERKDLAEKVHKAKGRQEIESLIGKDAADRYYNWKIGGSTTWTSLVHAMKWDRFDSEAEAKLKKSPAPPKLRGFNFDQHVKIAADSIEKLRKSDVYRLVSEAPSVAASKFVASEISRKRPDLASEADMAIYDHLQEIEPPSENYRPTLAAAIVDRFMAEAMGMTAEQYAARKSKNSPGQMSLWDDTATESNLLRTSARQKSFDWDESKVKRDDVGKFAEKVSAKGPATASVATEAKPETKAPEPEKDQPKSEPDAKQEAKGEPEREPNAPGVSLQMIPYNLAYQAHAGISFSPEVRAKSRQKEFADEMNSVYGEFASQAKTDEQKAILAEEWPRFLSRSKAAYSAMLSARGRVVSPMITGPARFPTRRNEKANDSADKRTQEYIDQVKKGRSAILKKINPAEGPARIGDKGTGSVLEKKLEQLEQYQDAAKKLNVMVRKVLDKSSGKGGAVFKKGYDMESAVKAIVDSTGLREKTVRDSLEPDFAGRFGVPSYSLQNNNAQIRRVKQQIADQGRFEKEAEKAEAGEKKTEFDFEGGLVRMDYADNRIRIAHDKKPDRSVIDKLKRSGWRWSPSNSAWQRQLTNAAKESAQELLGISLRDQAAYSAGSSISAAIVDRFMAEASGITIEEYAARRKKSSPGQQEFEWITVNADKGKGQPVMIDKKDGTIKAGMGGKFDGQKISEIGKGKGGTKAGDAKGKGKSAARERAQERFRELNPETKPSPAKAAGPEVLHEQIGPEGIVAKVTPSIHGYHIQAYKPDGEKFGAARTVKRGDDAMNQAKKVAEEISHPDNYLSEQEKTERESATNASDVAGDPPNARSRNLHRAIGYQNSLLRHYERKIQRGEGDAKQLRDIIASTESEIQWYESILRDRNDLAGGGPYSDESGFDRSGIAIPKKKPAPSPAPNLSPQDELKQLNKEREQADDLSVSYNQQAKRMRDELREIAMQKSGTQFPRDQWGRLTRKQGQIQKQLTEVETKIRSVNKEVDKLQSRGDELAAKIRGSEPKGESPAPSPTAAPTVPGMQASLFGGDDLNTGQKSLFNMVRPTKADQRAAKKSTTEASLLEQIDDEQKKREGSRKSFPGQREAFSAALADRFLEQYRTAASPERPKTVTGNKGDRGRFVTIEGEPVFIVGSVKKTADGDYRTDNTRAKAAQARKKAAKESPGKFVPVTAIEKAAAAKVGTESKQDAEWFVGLMKDAHNDLAGQARAEREAMQSLLGNFGKGGQKAGSFMQSIRYKQDHDKIPGFDEMAEFAKRYHPELLQPIRGESSAPGSQEDMLFARLKRGYPEVPAKDSSEVADYAWEKNQIDQTGFPSEWGGDEEDDDPVPFSAARASRVERYRPGASPYHPAVIERLAASAGNRR